MSASNANNSNWSNGASLEDCSTNVFVLTELTGLKWKKFVTSDQSRGCTEILEDPILRAYGRCLSDGLLCVWRRAPPTIAPAAPNKLDVRLDSEKELWVFWYAEEPDTLRNLTATLTNPEDGKGSWDEGIGYETRTLLFKALHNLIERCLLSKGLVRLGKWFTQPLDATTHAADQGAPPYVMAFNFSFFVHGENNVCVCVSTQRQPTICKLNRQHLSQTRKQPVILAPWSLMGLINSAAVLESESLDGVPRYSNYMTDRQANKHWHEWCQFYPLPETDDNTENLGYVDPVEKERQEAAKALALPKMIEVSVAGVRMLYPTCYVVVAASEDHTLLSRSSDCKREKKTQSNTASAPPIRLNNGLIEDESLEQAHSERVLNGTQMSQRTIEALLVGPGASGAGSVPDSNSGQSTPSGEQPGFDDVQWTFGDCCQKEMCGCRVASVSSYSKPPVSKGALKVGVQRADARFNRSLAVFHRRSPVTVRNESDEQSMLSCRPVVCKQSNEPGADTKGISVATGSALPPHEPITQMISPVASTQSVPQMDVKKEAPLAPPKLPSPKMRDNVVLPRRLAVPLRSAATVERPLKRPQLETLDAVVIAEENGEYLHSSAFYSYSRRFASNWRRPQSATVMAESYKFDSSTDDRTLGLAHKTKATDPVLSGYIRINDDSTPASDYLRTMGAVEDGAKTKRWEHGQALSARDLQPSATLPDNILEDRSLSHETSPSATFMSPPASNETDQNGQQPVRPTTSCAPTLGGSVVPPRQNGPPSIEYIYPTPPSMEAVYHQMSPENRQVCNPAPDQRDMSPVVRAPVPLNNAVEKPAPVIKAPETENKLIFSHPQFAHYLASSKFFGPCSVKRRRWESGNTFEPYRPSQTTRITAVAVTAYNKQPSTPGQPRPSAPPYSRSFSGGAMTPSPIAQQTPSPGYGAHMSPYPATSGPPSLMQRTPSAMQATPAITDSIQSPLSNASSTTYPRNLSSMDNSVQLGSCSMGPGVKVPEAHSLVVTLLLCDTSQGLHHDASFDSAPICACYSNISGLEMGLYVASATGVPNNPNSAIRCTCGFSAVRYRYLSHRAGLVAEDERESTGQWYGPEQCASLNRETMDAGLWDLIRQQSLSVSLTHRVYMSDWLHQQCANLLSPRVRPCNVNTLNEVIYECSPIEFRDMRDLCHSAMEAACMVMDCTTPSKADVGRRGQVVNLWGFQSAKRELDRDNESLALLNDLLSLLRDSLRSQRGLWNASHSVDGPLTWRNFERKSLRTGTGAEEDCQPEPVPQVLLTTEKDFITISPLALRLWDRLLLEPYSQSKDVVYFAVVPDSQFVIQQAKIFFRELSKTYENHRLGRHCPFAKVLRDGFLRVSGRTLKQQNAQGYTLGASMEELLRIAGLSAPEQIGAESVVKQREIIERLRTYALLMQHFLAPMINSEGGAFDRQIFRDAGKENQVPSNNDQSMPPPAAPAHMDQSQSSDTSANQDALGTDLNPDPDMGSLPHVVVVYLVNPFLFGPENENKKLAQFCTRALLMAYQNMIEHIKEIWQPFVQLEIVDLQMVLDCTVTMYDCSQRTECVCGAEDNNPNKWTCNACMPKSGAAESLKSLSFSAYTQGRALSAQCLISSQAKTMTGFGPAAARCATIERQMNEQTRMYTVYCSPYVLVPATWSRPALAAAAAETTPRDEDVLFVSYCFSENLNQPRPNRINPYQRWLLACVTDQQGSMLENRLINLNTADKRFNLKPNAFIREALTKLWKSVLGVLAQGSRPWRIVIGRLGRLGHNELKVWYQLLHKSTLKRFGTSLKETCGQCSQMPGFNETPAILSACLVSLEAEPFLRVFARSSSAKQTGKPESVKSVPLNTPEDASCTHILVFPTSANISPAPSGPGKPDEDLDGLIGGLGDLGDPDELAINLNDLFGADSDLAPPSAPPGASRNFLFPDVEMSTQLDQQPLATGFYVSTAPAPCLPAWFWSSCPWARRRCPVHLRASLHINTSGVQLSDEQLTWGKSKQTSSQQQHALESTHTYDVLRYVLETYNALSWLNMDLETGDRRSCLPVHIQALLRLNHSVNIFLP